MAHTNQTACKAVEKHLEEVAQKRPASVRPAGERCGKPGTAGRAPQHSETTRYQKSTEPGVHKLPFLGLVQEAAQDFKADLQLLVSALRGTPEA